MDKQNSNLSPLNTELQRGQSFPTWRTFAKAGALFATLTGLLLLHTGCGGDGYETVEVIDTIVSEKPTQGVITTVKEVKPNQFAIENEEVVPDTNATKVVVKYLDGRTENLSVAEARARVAPQDSAAVRDTALHVVADTGSSSDTSTNKTPNTKSGKITTSGNTTTHTTDDGKTIVVVNNTTPQYHSSYSPGMHTLGYVLMGGAMGYYMGKSMSMPPNPNVYQNPQRTYNSRVYSGGSGGGGAYSSLRSTATKTTSYRSSYKSVPSGRSGYFGGRSSSKSGGYSS